MSSAGEWAERARKAQEAVNELGAGPPGRLTGHERRIIADARRLASLKDDRAIMAATGEANPEGALSNALGQAQYVLAELADIAERLGGE
jgi:hypothetical protein